jgi:chondroitin AC lyase
MFDFHLKYGECTQNSNCVSEYQCTSACADAKIAARTIDTNGTWADVNYTSNNHVKWGSFKHVQRVLSMVRSFHCMSCEALHADAATLEKVHRGLNWWLNQNPTPPQWWWRDIGLPNAIGGVMILLGANATADELSKADAMMLGAGVPTHGTGENVLWEQQVAFTRAVLSNDTATAWEVVHYTWLDVQVVTGHDAEGVMSDGSFHFHGNILYSGGYGSDYAINLVAFASLTAGTSFHTTATPSLRVRWKCCQCTCLMVNSG